MSDDPWDNALGLREGARQAQGRGELEAAARGFADAYQVSPEPCSSRTLMILFETVEAHLKAAEKIDGEVLCRVEEFVETASANPACTANLVDLATFTHKLKRARARSGSECSMAQPISREISEHVPLEVEFEVPAQPPAKPPAPFIDGPKPKGDQTGARKRRPRLMAAGGSLLGLGVGATVAALVGMTRGIRLEHQVESKVTAVEEGCHFAVGLSGACADLARDGKAMNRVAIGAGIGAAVLVISGAILVAAGARSLCDVRRSRVALQGTGFTVGF